MCAETVARLRIYRAVAAANGAALAGDLFTSMTDFEAEITTNAQNEEWGDFLVEKLTTVRREWSDARSAHDSGDEAAAKTHADAALAELDAASVASAAPEGYRAGSTTDLVATRSRRT